MWNRTTILLLVVGAVGGYAVRGTNAPLRAQSLPQGAPMAVGDSVILRYQALGPDVVPFTETCEVLELRGPFVRCAPAKESRSVEEWRNLRFVVSVGKLAK
jgi:hypothetical protein